MDEVTRNVQDVVSLATEIGQACRDLENKLRLQEFLLLMTRREFATWVLSRARETPGFDLSIARLGIGDMEVVNFVKKYQDHDLGPCRSCRRPAPLDENGYCAWGCSPRSPSSMAPPG